MTRLLRSRPARTLAMLVGVCLLLTACDMERVLRLTRADGVGHSDAPARAETGGGGSAAGDAAADGPATAPAATPTDGTGADTVDTGGGGAPVGGDGDAGTGGGQPGDAGPSTCDHTIPEDVDEADGAANYAAVAAGDTVCLTAGIRGPLELRNFHGADGGKITFVNSGGTVDIRGDDGDYAGIQIEDSDHIRVTGAGTSRSCGARVASDAQRCGIRILGPARSLTGKVRTEHIRVDHVEMGDTSQSAVSIKDHAMGRGEWVADDIVLEHNYIHDVRDEGVYIGSSDYARGDEHVLHGVHLRHNLVVRTGRDGLQVGSATRDCTIVRNVIRSTGRNNESSHRAGVMNNKGSVCDIFNNFITDTAGWGIYVQGNGSNEVYNNVVVRAGRLVGVGSDDGDGISVHDGSNVSNSIRVWNNTVVRARGDGIGWSNDVGADNQIRNNIAVASGGVDIDRDSNVTISNNLTGSVAAAAFVDPAADDYRLRPDSPARDAGAGLGELGVTEDHDGTPRPQGPAHDIGAYEIPNG